MTDHLNTLQGLCKKAGYKKKVAIALSGGIDSTASAILLIERGYQIIALFMRIHDASLNLPKHVKACFGPSEEKKIILVKKICKILDIPLYVIDLKKDFKEYVLSYFKKEYLKGRTPNPCIHCNAKIKFNLLVNKAKNLNIGFDLFATGHHAKIEKIGNRYVLKKAYDISKDQSYFLYALNQNQLSHTIFPAGEHKKKELKKIVASLDIGIEHIKESQDFISGSSYSLLFKDSNIQQGPIVNKNGDRLGTHKGIIYYTIGQRKGLGLFSSRPYYVIGINAEENKIIVGHKEDLLSNGLIAKEINFVGIDKIEKPMKAKVKIRQQHKESDAILYPIGNKIKVIFDTPQMAITPGQCAVFYKENMVLGGGIIESSIKGEKLCLL